MGLVAQVFDEPRCARCTGDLAHRPHPLLDHRRRRAGPNTQPVMRAPPAPDRRARPQRQPRRTRPSCAGAARPRRRLATTTDTEVIARADLRRTPATLARRPSRDAMRRIEGAFSLVVLTDERARRLPRPRRASGRWCSATSNGAPGAWPPRPARSTSSAPRSSATSSRARWSSIDDRRRRASPGASPPAGGAGALHLRVHLLRPPRLAARRRRPARRAHADGRAAGAPRRPVDGRHRDRACPTPARRPRRATREASGIPYAEAWSRTATSAARSSSPTQALREHGVQAEVQSAPRRDRGQARRGRRRLDRARHDHAADRRRCCATRAPPRCTCASRRRRSCGPATTASTWPTATELIARATERSRRSATYVGADSLGLPLAGRPAGGDRRRRATLLPRLLRRRATRSPIPERAGKFVLEHPARAPAPRRSHDGATPTRAPASTSTPAEAIVDA